MHGNDTQPSPATTAVLAGVPVRVVDSVDEATQFLLALAQSGSGSAVHFINAYTFSLTRGDESLRNRLRCDLNFADGAPIAWWSRTLGFQVTQTPGPEVFERTLELSRDLRHGFIGGTEETLTRLRGAVQQRFPHAEVAGMWSPPFKDFDANDIANFDSWVRSTRADIIWVGLGTPKQDYVVHDLATATGVPCVAVGAAFSFTAGTLQRAPEWMIRARLEWLFRFAQEPRRLWRRYILGNPRFVQIAARDIATQLRERRH